MPRSLVVRLGRVSVILTALLCLEAIVRSGLVSALIISAPSTVALKAWEDVQTGELVTHLGVTALEFSVAFGIALLLGSGLGLLFYRFRLIRLAAEPFLVAVYAAPTLLLYPVFLALFGLGSMAVISMAVVSGSIPIMANVTAGLLGVERMFIKFGRSLRATSWQLFWKIMLPAATPTIFSGVRLGFTYTLVSVVAVEFFLFSGGLGRMVSW